MLYHNEPTYTLAFDDTFTPEERSVAIEEWKEFRRLAFSPDTNQIIGCSRRMVFDYLTQEGGLTLVQRYQKVTHADARRERIRVLSAQLEDLQREDKIDVMRERCSYAGPPHTWRSARSDVSVDARGGYRTEVSYQCDCGASMTLIVPRLPQEF